ncbi:MAG: cation diffusion facilitator family transporter, partial [archaeon]|nr:cation diffusion facilitator family transporter [archaeon]
MNKENVSILAVAVNVLLAVSKISIGLISKSSAVLAEGIHSAMDILSSLLNLFGVKISKKPVDKEHPYGHYKFEVLSGLIITIILFLTGLYILYRSYQSFLNPELIEISYLALAVMGFSAIINEVMARLKISVGKKESSISLISDGVHSRVDVISSIMVFVGLFLTPIFVYSDALLTLLIGLYIIKESFSLGKEATDSLLDISAGDEVENEIRDIAKSNNIDLSEIKTQKKGSAITANLVIKLPHTLNVKDATKISEN